MGTKKIRRALVYRIAFVLFVFIVSLELVLHLAHWAIVLAKPAEVFAHPGAPIILCLGDSHTYGIRVGAEESYPARLQKTLDENGYIANVVNLGIPGQNSSQVRRLLPELVYQYRPSVVILLIGANNRWNVADRSWSEAEDGVGREGIIGRVQGLGMGVISHLRTPRLVINLYRWQSARIKAEMPRNGNGKIMAYHHLRPDPEWVDISAAQARLERDLRAMARAAAASNFKLVLMNYPAQPDDPYYPPNSIINRVALFSEGVTLVDIEKLIEPLLSGQDNQVDEQARARLFFKEDIHLTAEGYTILSKGLFKTLEDKGVLKDLKN